MMEVEPVLSTLKSDGRRRWIKPRLFTGRFWHARRIVAYALIALFVALPFVRINAKPAVFLDVVNRHFTLFGYTFLPTDTILLALFMVGAFLSVFLVTAIAGRAWCGWGCPQTVYMEFIFRPLERFFEGTVGRGGSARVSTMGARKAAYYMLVVILCVVLANVFLSYFVGVDTLSKWCTQSPFQHPQGFLVMFVTSLLMVIDFAFFREQLCVLACPYGRFQSVLLDRESTIVGYDVRRGEPRGSLTLTMEAMTPTRGDCIDCKLCVAACPTGIDIRKGLQMECIACTQCIDACDQVMTKIAKPTGLIRYCSQAELDGKPRRWLRPRVLAYPAALLAVGGLFLTLLLNKADTDVTVMRSAGNPFNVLTDGTVSNSIKLKITNRGEHAVQYRLELPIASNGKILAGNPVLDIAAGESRTETLTISMPRELFADGSCELTLTVSSDPGFHRDLRCRLLGPQSKEVEHESRHE